VSEVGGISKAGCTANDVALTAIVPGTLNITNNGCVVNNGVLSGTVTFSAIGQFVLTTQTRYDVGLYIDTNGDPEPAVDNKGTPDFARSGQCTRFAFSNTDGVNVDGDSCGDLTQAIAAAPNGRAMPFGPVTIKCVDKNNDGKVDVYHCETWAQRADEIACLSSTDVRAGTTSKCNCGVLAGACIPVPNPDPCKVNVCTLRCSGDASISCTIGGTECTGKGFCTDTLVTQNAADGTACGDGSSGDCKAPDSCQAGICTTGFKAATTTCRPAAGDCDVLESCTGSSVNCPPDVFKASSVQCRASAGVCDVAENCTGSSANCPADGFVSATTTCRASAGVCDPLESCTGASAACPADAKSTALCRSSAGVCDVDEFCDGIHNDCPVDGFKASTTICRTGSGDPCDPGESCTGTSAACPPDVCLGGVPHP
jgi:hypothetical protein